MNYLEVFAVLQLLDLLTALIGLRVGANEASPFIAWMMRLMTPLAALTVAKCIAFGWCALCLYRRKPKAIHIANYFFCGVVLWNLWHISALTRLWG
jgi:hypothetical protein